jgi:HEAT repeat protein
MKYNRVIAIFALVLLLVTVGLSAQDEDTGSLTIEELYLSTDIEVQLLRSQATSDNRENKLLALLTIQQMLDEGSVTASDAEIVAVLESLAGEGVTSTVRSGGRIVNDFPEVRRQAVALLGQVGGPVAQDILFQVVKDDPEPMVLSEAVYALGVIGDNSNQRTAIYLADVLERNTARVNPDNNLAFACLLSMEKLMRTEDGIANPEILTALIDVVGGNYIQTVRFKALDVIQQLRDSARN